MIVGAPPAGVGDGLGEGDALSDGTGMEEPHDVSARALGAIPHVRPTRTRIGITINEVLASFSRTRTNDTPTITRVMASIRPSAGKTEPVAERQSAAEVTFKIEILD